MSRISVPVAAFRYRALLSRHPSDSNGWRQLGRQHILLWSLAMCFSINYVVFSVYVTRVLDGFFPLSQRQICRQLFECAEMRENEFNRSAKVLHWNFSRQG